MTFSYRALLQLSAGAIGFLAAWPAMAQQSTPAVAQDAPQISAGQPASSESSGLEEIVVTARHRSEKLQSVPISVTSFSASQLQDRNIRDLTQLSALSPSLSSGQAGYSTLDTVFSIRGQRVSDTTLDETPSIGIYVDDVYRSTTIGLAASGLQDATDVEVLKGPQGTLYGRNTTGGAIKVTTPLPDYDALSGTVKLGFGNYSDANGFAAVNIPLVDNRVALRVTAYGESRDGFGRDVVNNHPLADLHSYAFTGTVRVAVTDQLEAIFRGGTNASYSGSNVEGVSYIQPFGAMNLAGAEQFGFITPAQLATIFAGKPTPQTLAAVGAALKELNAKYVAPYSYNKYYGQQSGAKTAQQSASMTLNYDVNDTTTLKSITAYQRFVFGSVADVDDTQINVLDGLGDAQNTNQYTQELRLSGSLLDNKLTYTAGYYFFDLNGSDIANVIVLPGFGAPTLNNSARVDDTSNSLYLQASYEFVPTVTFTGGIRGTTESTEADIRNTSNAGAICQVPATDRVGGACFGTYKNDFQNLSYTAGLDWKPEPGILLYAKTSRGFKAGGQNIEGNATGGYNSFGPETVTDYEVGVKTEFLDHRLRFDAALYRSDYKNIQRLVLVPGFGGSVNTAIFNAAAATIDGLEAELTAKPNQHLTLGASGSWTNARYDKFVDPATQANLASQKFSGVPKWLGSIYATVEYPISFGSVSATADAEYQSSVDFSPGGHQTPNLAYDTTQGGYTLFNARVALYIDKADLEIAVYSRNITDRKYFSYGQDYTGAGLGYAIVDLGAPRTFGVQLTKKF